MQELAGYPFLFGDTLLDLLQLEEGLGLVEELEGPGLLLLRAYSENVRM